MKPDAVINHLRYIADSPPQENGGFSPHAIATAKQAIFAIDRLRTALADAIRRPMGVVPDSAIGLVSDAELESAEARRVVERKEASAPRGITFPPTDRRTDSECFNTTKNAMLEVARTASWLDDPRRFADQPDVRGYLDETAESLQVALDYFEKAFAAVRLVSDAESGAGEGRREK